MHSACILIRLQHTSYRVLTGLYPTIWEISSHSPTASRAYVTAPRSGDSLRGGLARAWHVFKLVMETQISTALVQPPKRGNEKGQRSPCTAVSPSLSSYSRLSIHQCSRQVSLSVLVVGIYSVQREWMCPGQVACNLLLSEQHWPVFLFFSPSQYCTILLNGYSPEWGGTDVTGMTFVVKM